MIITRHNPYGRCCNKPKLIVIHAMGENIMRDDRTGYEHAPDFLERMKLSAHMLVQPDGTMIRCRSDDEIAFHAQGFNTNSLGMEILVPGNHTYSTFVNDISKPYLSDAQYLAAVTQCKKWIELHGSMRILRHSDLSPGRKLDPGSGFPWDKFLIDLRT